MILCNLLLVEIFYMMASSQGYLFNVDALTKIEKLIFDGYDKSYKLYNRDKYMSFDRIALEWAPSVVEFIISNKDQKKTQGIAPGICIQSNLPYLNPLSGNYYCMSGDFYTNRKHYYENTTLMKKHTCPLMETLARMSHTNVMYRYYSSKVPHERTYCRLCVPQTLTFQLKSKMHYYYTLFNESTVGDLIMNSEPMPTLTKGISFEHGLIIFLVAAFLVFSCITFCTLRIFKREDKLRKYMRREGRKLIQQKAKDAEQGEDSDSDSE